MAHIFHETFNKNQQFGNIHDCNWILMCSNKQYQFTHCTLTLVCIRLIHKQISDVSGKERTLRSPIYLFNDSVWNFYFTISVRLKTSSLTYVHMYRAYWCNCQSSLVMIGHVKMIVMIRYRNKYPLNHLKKKSVCMMYSMAPLSWITRFSQTDIYLYYI